MPRLAIVSPFQIAKKPEDADGDDARHGFDRNDPPKGPMSLSEAKALIMTLLQKWLQWKCEQQKQNSKIRHRLRNESRDQG